MVELRKSLHTANSQEARRRCLKATIWFGLMMDEIKGNLAADRTLLEQAAIAFFTELAAEVDRPREIPLDDMDNHIAMNVEESRHRIDELHVQLVTRNFEKATRFKGEGLASAIGRKFEMLPPAAQQAAMELAARAETEQMKLLVHLLTNPAGQYRPSDDLFQTLTPPQVRTAVVPPPSDGIGLGAASTMYLRMKANQRVRASQLEEIGRALKWLAEELGLATPMDAISTTGLRKIRTDFTRLDRTLRGRSTPFRDRLTDDPARQISSATAVRYWRSVQGFFRWAFEEDHCSHDPAVKMRIAAKKGEPKRTPPPYSNDELVQLFKIPLYAGYLSASRLLSPGKFHRRLGHWWSGILPMFTGLRASEVAQLLPTDFIFDSLVPHLKVRREDETGTVVKTTKTEASVRDIPLHPILLQLGLKEFVARQAKTSRERVFRDIAMGSHRTSTGLTKFWTRALEDAGVWKPGRATHVWRHTVIACLRRNGAAEEDIGAFVGHSGKTVTSGYGGAYPLTRLADTAALIEYGFDVVGALGGPFDAKRHG